MGSIPSASPFLFTNEKKPAQRHTRTHAKTVFGSRFRDPGLGTSASYVGALLTTDELPPLTNVVHIWMLITLFFASAQAFNSVLPERGLLHWLFSFFFLWTLWNNQFSSFDPPRLLRSLAILFGTAFVLKHILLASLYSAEGGWLKRVAGTLLQGVSLGMLDAPNFAPATGYICFFTLTLYVAGLILLAFAGKDEADLVVHPVIEKYQLPNTDRLAVRDAILDDDPEPVAKSERQLAGRDEASGDL